MRETYRHYFNNWTVTAPAAKREMSTKASEMPRNDWLIDLDYNSVKKRLEDF